MFTGLSISIAKASSNLMSSGMMCMHSQPEEDEFVQQITFQIVDLEDIDLELYSMR